MDAAAGKQFLISRVIEQAELEHIPLSDIEKKMLQFTETQPSLPDIYEVNAAFERDYNSDEYEAKVARLLKSARDRDGKQSAAGEQEWKDALDSLREEDHYILVMAGQAFGFNTALGGTYRRAKLLIYVAVGIGIALILVLKNLLRR